MLGSGLWIIQRVFVNPLDKRSISNLRSRSFLNLVLARTVLGSGFMVRDSW